MPSWSITRSTARPPAEHTGLPPNLHDGHGVGAIGGQQRVRQGDQRITAPHARTMWARTHQAAPARRRALTC
jgi:hypothetical protein